MAALTEQNYIGDIIKWEMENRQSRETVTVEGGQDLSRGAVIGRIIKSIPTEGTADAGNTGNGTCTDVSGGPETVIGTYKIIVSDAANNIITVVNPEGVLLPEGAVGTPYANAQINFTVTAGGDGFADGDFFTVEVTQGSGKVKAIDFDATDGSQTPCGILVDDCDASGGDKQAVAIVRDAQIDADNLVWPDGATDEQKSAALRAFVAAGIVTRTSV